LLASLLELLELKLKIEELELQALLLFHLAPPAHLHQSLRSIL